MLLLRKFLVWSSLVSVSVVLSTLCLSQVSFAASVKACKKLKESTLVVETRDTGKDKRVYCTVSPKVGNVGDFVEIKNQYNYIVAVGRVVKQAKANSIVVLTRYDREEGSMAGYPAMLRINENQDYWTATSAPF
jgi:hypothetical protein